MFWYWLRWTISMHSYLQKPYRVSIKMLNSVVTKLLAYSPHRMVKLNSKKMNSSVSARIFIKQLWSRYCTCSILFANRISWYDLPTHMIVIQRTKTLMRRISITTLNSRHLNIWRETQSKWERWYHVCDITPMCYKLLCICSIL